MQTMQEWMQAHNYQCDSATAFALGYTDVADCWSRTDNIDYMLIGAWEQAMDGLWDGGRSYIESWIVSVIDAMPDRVAGDRWPLGSLPENMGRHEYYVTAREFAKSIIDGESDQRVAGTLSVTLCQMLRDCVPFNPMQNAL